MCVRSHKLWVQTEKVVSHTLAHVTTRLLALFSQLLSPRGGLHEELGGLSPIYYPHIGCQM